MKTPTPKAKCPVCSRRVDAATEMTDTGSGPGPGDLTICAYCASIVCFNEDMTLRLSTVSDHEKYSPRALEDMWTMQKIIL